MIHQPPSITGTLRRSLNELDELHASLAHEVRRPRAWQGKLRRDALVNAIVSSTAIEGYSVPSAEARSLVEGASPTTRADANHWAIASYARAMDHVHAMADDQLFEWNHRVVLALHFDTCHFSTAARPGRYRKRGVHVTAPDGGIAYSAPPSADVAPLMAEAVNWLENTDELHVVVRAAMAHLHLVAIHPFNDGNGRVARILQSLVLARAGILAPEFASIEPFLAAHTNDYYAALATTQRDASYSPAAPTDDWIEFCVTAHLRMGRDMESRMHALSRYWTSVERIVADRGWPDRFTIAIDQAMHHGLTRAAYAAEAEISIPTASLDLRRIVDAEFLVQHGSGRTTSYLASDVLRTAIENDG